MTASTHKKSALPGKANEQAKPHVSTIRLDDNVRAGLQIFMAHSGVKWSLNKIANVAIAAFIDHQVDTIESELDQALRNIEAYRKSGHPHRHAIKAFIDAEVAFAATDPMEGTREPQMAGPAVSVVREILSG